MLSIRTMQSLLQKCNQSIEKFASIFGFQFDNCNKTIYQSASITAF